MRGHVNEALIFIRKAAKENKLQLSPEMEAKLVDFHDIVVRDVNLFSYIIGNKIFVTILRRKMNKNLVSQRWLR
jgi:hypothetical protein